VCVCSSQVISQDAQHFPTTPARHPQEFVVRMEQRGDVCCHKDVSFVSVMRTKYSSTSWDRVFEGKIISQLKEFPLFYGTRTSLWCTHAAHQHLHKKYFVLIFIFLLLNKFFVIVEEVPAC
jgi:hypothetical protein